MELFFAAYFTFEISVREELIGKTSESERVLKFQLRADSTIQKFTMHAAYGESVRLVKIDPPLLQLPCTCAGSSDSFQAQEQYL